MTRKNKLVDDLTLDEYYGIINQDSVLDIPKELQNDSEYAYGWKRIMLNEQPDLKNLHALTRDRWVPVRLDELPEGNPLSIMAQPITGVSKFLDQFGKDALVYKDVMLMKCPKKFVEARRRVREEMTNRLSPPSRSESLSIDIGSGKSAEFDLDNAAEVAYGQKTQFGD